MRCKLKSRPMPPGSPSGQTYVEFIVLAVLAVIGSAAIVLFVVKPATAPPTAQADGVAAQQDTPESIAIAASDEQTEQLPVEVDDEQPGGDAAAASADVKPAADDFATRTHSLSVTATGGSITSSPAQGSYNHGDTVTLEAVPNAGYSFTNWSGDLSGSTNPATLVMEADKSVTAGFAPKTYRLAATAIGGSITKRPDQASYNHGDTVTLQAVPNAGYSFRNWSGDLSGSTNPATVLMEADRAVTAAFARASYNLTISATGGSVTKSPDQASYSHGDTVTLEAVPNTGYSFANWAGGLSGSTNPAKVLMEADASVTATFALEGHRLTVAAVGGSVKRTPAKASYESGETVTLEAVPNAGHSFTDWSGDLSGAANPVTLTIDGDKSVTAGFALTAQTGGVVTNSVGMKLIYIPAGSFMMGSGDSAIELAEQYGKRERDFVDELPQHQVTISQSFWMGQTEVTQGQYSSVMNAQPWSGKAYVQIDADNPAVYVSWDDSMEFCARLSQKEGRNYRLPTEAEWEYACRAGTTSRFGFGDSDSSLGDYAWFDDNADKAGQDYAHLVGQKKPNAWGICDMHGNVFEWCSDLYDQKYYSNSPSVDPTGPTSGISHSLRGGSWDDGANRLRSSYRSGYRVSRGLLVGFRVVSDGRAVSDVGAISIAAESVRNRAAASDESVKAQEPAPVAAEVKRPVPVPAQTPRPAPVPVEVKKQAPPPVEVPKPAPVVAKPQEARPVAAKAQPEATVAPAAALPLIGAGGTVYERLDQAAVAARLGSVQQAQAVLTSLLKDKDAAVMAGYELGRIHYENGDVEKAMPFFKDALSSAFGPASGKDEPALTALLNQEEDAARIRYELGLICQSQGEQGQAAKLFRDSLSIVSAKGATYIGVKKCKSCHFKQWNSWRKTKMATTFEALKPGARAEEKVKLKFDPKKDYTKDPTCLSCHTSGFGIPGGYVIPADGDAAAKEQAADNAGVTCEGCHGPGSKSVEIQEDIKENKRPYKFAELRAVGFHQAGVRSCTPCHNASDPGKEPGYHFNYEEERKEDQHENVPLKYRQD